MPVLPKTALGPLPFFHIITTLSSPPDAKYNPFIDQRTQFTHAKWFSNLHNIFGMDLLDSASGDNSGFRFHITTKPSGPLPWPPVANFVPSGWTSIEKIGFSAIEFGIIYTSDRQCFSLLFADLCCLSLPLWWIQSGLRNFINYRNSIWYSQWKFLVANSNTKLNLIE